MSYIFGSILLIGVLLILLSGGKIAILLFSVTLTTGLITFRRYYKTGTALHPYPLPVVYSRRLNWLKASVMGVGVGILWTGLNREFSIVQTLVESSILPWQSADFMSLLFIPVNLAAIIISVYMLIFRERVGPHTERSPFWVVEGMLLGGFGTILPMIVFRIMVTWVIFFSLIGALILGITLETNGIVLDIPPFIHRYEMSFYIGGIIGGMILGGGLGIITTGILGKILGRKTWQRSAPNLWDLSAGLSVGIISSILIVWIFLNSKSMPSGFYLTQAQAEKWAGIFCLPTYLPKGIDPYPIFYKAGDLSAPDIGILYKNIETSEGMFIIEINNVSQTHSVQVENDYHFYDPAKSCSEPLVLLNINDLQVCYFDWSARPVQLPSIAGVTGPPFITNLEWQLRRDKQVVVYTLESSLSLEDTQKIVESMCSE